jgi:hypothetical protein
MNCWQCRGHACDATTHVRDGRGQVGQAAAHFCARLNAFKRLTSLLCNSNKSAHMACPRRFESFMTSRCCASARRLPDAQGGECTGLRQPPVWRAGRRSPVPSANRPQSVRGGAKSDPTGRRANMAATVRPAPMPGTSIRKIHRASGGQRQYWGDQDCRRCPHCRLEPIRPHTRSASE